MSEDWIPYDVERMEAVTALPDVELAQEVARLWGLPPADYASDETAAFRLARVVYQKTALHLRLQHIQTAWWAAFVSGSDESTDGGVGASESAARAICEAAIEAGERLEATYAKRGLEWKAVR